MAAQPGGGGQVLPQVLARQGAGNRQRRRGSPQEPGERDLRGCRVVPLGDLCRRSTAIGSQREVGNDHDVVVGAVVEDVVVRALGEVVVVLDGANRGDLSRPLDLVHRDVRDADVLNRAALPVLIDDPETLLQRSLRIRLMEVVEVDPVGPQPTKALLDLGA